MSEDKIDIPLICLPFAGAGASFFYAWRKLETKGVTIAPLQLPGRERRVDEPPFTDLHAAADSLLPAAAEMATGGPVAIFGHCFLGAALAYELTRRLVGQGETEVERLFVSASRAPSAGSRFNVEELGDDDFVDLVQRITGYRHPALDIPEMRELLIPTLRADFLMDEGYVPRDEAPLSVPVTAIFAAQDTLVPTSEVEEWRHVTSEEFDLLGLPGGHMYIANDPQPLLQFIEKTLARPEETADVATR